MDPSTTFYQALTNVSLALLGIWIGVMQFAHGGWRSDPDRHATTLHITMKFFLPGVLGLASLLGSAGDGGIVWRVSFVLGGLVGIGESLHYLLRGVGRPLGVRRLALLDPVLYALVVTVAFLPAGTLAVTPLQAEGMATGLVFITGLVGVWIALSERAPAPAAESAPVVAAVASGPSAEPPFEPGLYTHRALAEPVVRRPLPVSR